MNSPTSVTTGPALPNTTAVYTGSKPKPRKSKKTKQAKKAKK